MFQGRFEWWISPENKPIDKFHEIPKFKATNKSTKKISVLSPGETRRLSAPSRLASWPNEWKHRQEGRSCWWHSYDTDTRLIDRTPLDTQRSPFWLLRPVFFFFYIRRINDNQVPPPPLHQTTITCARNKQTEKQIFFCCVCVCLFRSHVTNAWCRCDKRATFTAAGGDGNRQKRKIISLFSWPPSCIRMMLLCCWQSFSFLFGAFRFFKKNTFSRNLFKNHF